MPPKWLKIKKEIQKRSPKKFELHQWPYIIVTINKTKLYLFSKLLENNRILYKCPKLDGKSKNTYKKYKKCLKEILTCTNDLRIQWWITEQNFSCFRNYLEIVEYNVKGPKWPKIQETHINIPIMPKQNFNFHQWP